MPGGSSRAVRPGLDRRWSRCCRRQPAIPGNRTRLSPCSARSLPPLPAATVLLKPLLGLLLSSAELCYGRLSKWGETLPPGEPTLLLLVSAQYQALPACPALPARALGPGPLNILFRESRVIWLHMGRDFLPFLVLQSLPETCVGSSLLPRHPFPTHTYQQPIAQPLLGLYLSTQLC